MIINKDRIEEVRRDVNRIKSKNEEEEIIVIGRDIEFNRKVLEIRKVNMLVLNHQIGKDKLKERDSGLNQVLCEIARKSNIILGIDFNDFITDDKKEKAKRLGRLIQNIKLMKKYGNKVKVINKPDDSFSLQALFRLLGSSSQLAKELSDN